MRPDQIILVATSGILIFFGIKNITQLIENPHWITLGRAIIPILVGVLISKDEWKNILGFIKKEAK